MGKLLNYFSNWSIFERAWLGISTALILSLSLYWNDNIIGIIASLTGIWCVVLVAKGRISNYYVGIVNVLAYAWVAYSWQYYGEVMLNLIYFLPMQFVGIYLWKDKIKGRFTEVEVRILSNIQRIALSGLILISIFTYGTFLGAIGGNLPYMDATSTILSIVAMVLMALRYVEQWALWILVNIASIGLWVYALYNGGNDIAVLIMWVAFFVNSIYGLVNWIKLYKKGV